MYPEQIKEQNTLKSWATGKVVMTVIGIAVGLYLFSRRKTLFSFFTKKGSTPNEEES